VSRGRGKAQETYQKRRQASEDDPESYIPGLGGGKENLIGGRPGGHKKQELNKSVRFKNGTARDSKTTPKSFASNI